MIEKHEYLSRLPHTEKESRLGSVDQSECEAGDVQMGVTSATHADPCR